MIKYITLCVVLAAYVSLSIAKLLGIINISWWFILSPILILVALLLMLLVINLFIKHTDSVSNEDQ